MFHRWTRQHEANGRQHYQCERCGQHASLPITEPTQDVQMPDSLCQPAKPDPDMTIMRKVASIVLLIMVTLCVVATQGCGDTDGTSVHEDGVVYCNLHPDDKNIHTCRDTPQLATKAACQEQEARAGIPIYIAVCQEGATVGAVWDEATCSKMFWASPLSRRAECS